MICLKYHHRAPVDTDTLLFVQATVKRLSNCSVTGS